MKAGCIGHPDKVRKQLTTYANMGIELFLFKFVPTVDEVHAIKHEIIDRLRPASPAAQRHVAAAE
jgi:hypothetical protein